MGKCRLITLPAATLLGRKEGRHHPGKSAKPHPEACCNQHTKIAKWKPFQFIEVILSPKNQEPDDFSFLNFAHFSFGMEV